MGRRRVVAVAAAIAAALVVALVVAVPRLLPGLAPDERAATPAVDPTCVARADAPVGEVGVQPAAWVRFCPLADEGAAQRVRHPQGVVTGDLAASVAASLAETQDGRPECTPFQETPGPTGLFRIEVGLADGRVAEIAGDTGCSARDQVLFAQLETTLLMQAAGEAGPPGAMPAPVTCPSELTTVRTNADGASAGLLVEPPRERWQSTVPLLALPAVAADVCAYRGDGRRREPVDQWQVGLPVAETVRSAATTRVWLGAVADCEPDPGATSYVVVLTDATGTARTLAIDTTRCSTVQAAVGTPPVDTYLGLAEPGLVRLVQRSRP
ncbi:hypothetical protein ASG76_11180 [Nocardioides sp. Soil774]|nr:hypothetical protein ASG76_11180 [Nocardioides sp. Soil774]